jgi:radical SAM superfamily enzyme YgiQ (UPF0313 family)
MAHIGAEFMMEDVPLRLEYLAAYVRQNVELVEVLDLANLPMDLKDAIRRYQPDLVGISINYISTHANALKLAEIAKSLGTQVVVGGYQATAMASELALSPFIDYVVRGEGEETFRELLSSTPIEAVRGISYEVGGQVVHNPDRPLIADLDSIPFPERRRRNRKYKLPFADLDSTVATAYEMIITSRGCWGRCTFCTEGLMTDGTQRYRKPEKVIEELDDILSLHPGKRLRIHIADPNFGGKRRITEELYERMIEWRKRTRADVHFFVSLRPSAISESREMVRKMAAAGIDYLFVGMESPNNAALKAVAKPGETRERQETAVRYLQEEGVEIMSNFLIGLPGQTPDDVLGLVEYAKKLKLADCYFSVMTPLPGSVLYEEAKKKGDLLEPDVTKYRLYDTVLRHDKMTRGQIRELCVRANARWYDDLMLPAEQRRAAAKGTKRRLYDFAGKFTVLVNFFSFLGSSAGKEFSDITPVAMVGDMPTPKLREFTEQNKVHDFIEMDRFLRILGNQRVQVTMQSQGQDIVTWEAVTTKNSLEYLAAVQGRPQESPSIAINVPMDPGSLSGSKMLQGILADNPTTESRINLLRLAAAAGTELASFYVDRMGVLAKDGLTQLFYKSKAHLSKLQKAPTAQAA